MREIVFKTGFEIENIKTYSHRHKVNENILYFEVWFLSSFGGKLWGHLGGLKWCQQVIETCYRFLKPKRSGRNSKRVPEEPV